MTKNGKIDEEKRLVMKKDLEEVQKDDSPVGIARESFYNGA